MVLVWPRYLAAIPAFVAAAVRVPPHGLHACPIERGVYVTRLWYTNPVRPKETLLTGLTRDGTFLIEDGRLSRGIRNLRYSESVLGMLKVGYLGDIAVYGGSANKDYRAVIAAHMLTLTAGWSSRTYGSTSIAMPYSPMTVLAADTADVTAAS